MEIALLIFLIFFLILCSGYFSGSEAALFSLPPTRLQVYKHDPNPRFRLIAQLLSRPQDLLVTVFMLNTLVNILLQNVAANLFGDFSSWALKVGVPLVLTLIFGEIIPKYIGLQNNVRFSYSVAPLISFIQKLLKPIRTATIAITTPLSRLMFFFLKKEPEMSYEETQHILQTSEKHGVFSSVEGELLAGYLQIQTAFVREVMRPREEILSYDINEPLSKLAYLFVDQQCTRVPVYNKNLDSILGIISAKQFFLQRDLITNSQDLLPFLSKPFYVPESMQAWLLLRRLSERGQFLALVVDEYGSITGLITQEDLIEVVVGEIKDLRDQTQLYTQSGKYEIIASGKLELETFNELFLSSLESPENMITIGGWLTEKLGEIPKTGSKHEIDGFLFQILASTPNRIRRLYVRKLQTERTV
ncbi:MAG: HlyC/CorC family transporter [Parachlamydiaceae bacterium]|nr:HlyC/CorC family transporter [Parachlamydiaceae bacterium]